MKRAAAVFCLGIFFLSGCGLEMDEVGLILEC